MENSYYFLEYLWNQVTKSTAMKRRREINYKSTQSDCPSKWIQPTYGHGCLHLIHIPLWHNKSQKARRMRISMGKEDSLLHTCWLRRQRLFKMCTCWNNYCNLYFSAVNHELFTNWIFIGATISSETAAAYEHEIFLSGCPCHKPFKLHCSQLGKLIMKDGSYINIEPLTMQLMPSTSRRVGTSWHKWT